MHVDRQRHTAVTFRVYFLDITPVTSLLSSHLAHLTVCLWVQQQYKQLSRITLTIMTALVDPVVHNQHKLAVSEHSVQPTQACGWPAVAAGMHYSMHEQVQEQHKNHGPESHIYT